MKVTTLLNRKRRIEKHSSNPGKAKDFFEVTPEMIASLDVHLGRDLLAEALDLRDIFKLSNDQAYIVVVTWANTRLIQKFKPEVKTLCPILPRQ